MAKYAELFEGARVVFNKGNRDGFDHRSRCLRFTHWKIFL